ncbi:MAG: hypothetical protein IPO07_29630 [Haliscomenobacter sp.]|nr:hypothetical protein [Haliscomenobacter sp.]MBK9492491.1 hypothetical protein [Haliscomenobacter sp.]
MLVRDVKKCLDGDERASNYTFAPLFKEMVKSGMNYRNPKAAAGVYNSWSILTPCHS